MHVRSNSFGPLFFELNSLHDGVQMALYLGSVTDHLSQSRCKVCSSVVLLIYNNRDRDFRKIFHTTGFHVDGHIFFVAPSYIILNERRTKCDYVLSGSVCR